MIPTGEVDGSFEGWLAAPLPLVPPHPSFEVRRAVPEEYPAIWDLVDSVVGETRPRSYYRWLYERNPLGRTRSWVIVARSSGRIVGHTAHCLWPVSMGAKRLPAIQGIDAAIAGDLQRRGLWRLRRSTLRAHPWDHALIRMGWPNDKSRNAVIKYGRASKLMSFSRVALPLAPGGPWAAAAAALLSTWRAVAARPRTSDRVREARSFDAAVDDLLRREAGWDRYWCWRCAEFLNWRYAHHPSRSYVILRAENAGRCTGYLVLRPTLPTAWIMELTAERASAASLVVRAVDVARMAGCRQIAWFAPPAWPHWGTLRRCGFLPWGTQVYAANTDADYGLAADLPENWCCVPGDVEAM